MVASLPFQNLGNMLRQTFLKFHQFKVIVISDLNVIFFQKIDVKTLTFLGLLPTLRHIRDDLAPGHHPDVVPGPLPAEKGHALLAVTDHLVIEEADTKRKATITASCLYFSITDFWVPLFHVFRDEFTVIVTLMATDILFLLWRGCKRLKQTVFIRFVWSIKNAILGDWMICMKPHVVVAKRRTFFRQIRWNVSQTF